MADQERNEAYYNQEARVYSQKRYPKVADNYVHFLFTHRRALVLALLSKVIAHTDDPRTLLEVGCADGILLRSIEERYPAAFKDMLGVDISEPMVTHAAALTLTPSIHFKVRDQLRSTGAFSVVLEIGVNALALDTKSELQLLSDQLQEHGYLLCSFAGRDSVASRMEKGATRRAQLHTYATYESALRERFTIVEACPYGLYIPLLWRFPAAARVLQPIAEAFGALVPNLCHEQVYLLKKK